ncbi:putative WD repeat-containing protein C26H5.03 [Psilocybe cubensis]|uniref:CAF1B/HIR1 beta-propeller domain-containing protein n=2 Tax=Psilocybe cubensis TaxID=181762 RepID=A0A8H8CI07_PSICU|nr:putative WD repeat-containing protein C26H5.03 [Psilocybe cubensis]KAH9474432.1 putative WD repeat-containing protein C26H5.03 [Psilocybe cubensis]
MRFRTLEIRWHDSKPISTCDFQPLPFKKARPAAGQDKNYASQSYRLATGGEDNHVRIWMVHPHIRPPTLLADADPTTANASRPPRVEYLATLSRHSAAVNVVRFSPNGELVASAGDDGMIIIWAPSASPQAATYGSDLSAEDLQYEKEYWKPRTTFRCTTMQVYDLAWSPTGEYIIAGSTDNTARVFAAADGKCVYEIAEHLHYVQGVAWDPLNEYIATQSSDRSMHIYNITTKPGGAFEVHAVGKNTRMPHRHSHSHSRTPSAHGGRPRMFRRASTASDLESSSAIALDNNDDAQSITSGHGREGGGAPLTPAMSVTSTPAFMFPPPPIEGSSRRSSFSSNAPGSPSTFSNNNNNSRYGRSPSPMPPLPAIRNLPSSSNAPTAALWASVKLYGDESYTNFFRRLTFSPDGGLLLTPAGQFEDPSVTPASVATKAGEDTTPTRGRKGHPSEAGASTQLGSSSSVYIYSRANFARPPIAQLPGHKKASVAVRFSPILYDLRSGVSLPGTSSSTAEENDKKAEGKGKDNLPVGVLEKGVDGVMDVDVLGPLKPSENPPMPTPSTSALMTPQRTPAPGNIVTPTPRPAISTSGINIVASSPALSPMDLRPPTPAESKPSTPAPSQTNNNNNANSGGGTVMQTGSVFALPYRMLFAVVTMDTVAIYDTQQASPLCLLTKLHYDEFTDMTWSPDGQCLILSSRDGYCTLIIFDDILPAYHTQQHTLQLQSIAHHHSVPISYGPNNHPPSVSASSAQVTPAATPSSASIGLPGPSQTSNPKKRSDPPLTPAASVDGSEAYFSTAQTSSSEQKLQQPKAGSSTGEAPASAVDAGKSQEPPKKKRRVALTRVGDLDS